MTKSARMVKKEFLLGSISESEVSYRNKVPPSSRPKITSSMEAVRQLRCIWSPNLERIEEFLVLILNRANRVLGWAKLSQGGLSGAVADPKGIFQVALKANASSLIIAHNHPSGNAQPSESDIALTRKVKEAGKMLELPVLDHLILTSEGYFSFADEGLL